jgi:protein dithiol:quinone oxidoreductase
MALARSASITRDYIAAVIIRCFRNTFRARRNLMADPRTIADRGGRLFTLIFLACLGILAFALYLQHVKDLDPCPWCVVQRLGFILVGTLALAAALHRPSGIGVRVYSWLVALAAAGGIAAAVYHLYLQADPVRAQACVGGAVEKLLDASRVGKYVPPVLMYDGPCTLKPWSLLGLSIPAWSLVCFAVLGAFALAIPRIARR